MNERGIVPSLRISFVREDRCTEKKNATGNLQFISIANVQTVNYSAKQNVAYIIKNVLSVIAERVSLAWSDKRLNL